MGKTQIIAEPGVPQIIATRAFKAPRELLFRAYTDPALLAQWLGPRRLTLTVDELDARHGGRWRYTHYDPEGRAFAFHGLYHGTPGPDRIVQTYEFEARPGHVYLNTITFQGQGNQTLLRQNTVFQSVEDRDSYVDAGMEEGLTESMDNLDALVTRLAALSN
ncbi:MAG TPA: SRPBCC family protein [Kribbella sp.]|nr:SRPBCC family protein [Kribbella sp.]